MSSISNSPDEQVGIHQSGDAEKSQITRPETWTPVFCRSQADGAAAREEYGLAHDWRMRALVLEDHAERRLKQQHRPHPFKHMLVDDDGRERSLPLTQEIKEEILGIMEGGMTALPSAE
jgi:hypothetical protein